jgi:hypothetical protein
MGPNPGEITQLLQQWRTGDRQVEDRLFDLLMRIFTRLPNAVSVASGPAIPSSQPRL